MRVRSMKWWFLAICAIALIVTAVTGLEQRRPDGAAVARQRGVPTVTVTEPRRTEMVRRVALTCDILGIYQADLTAKVPGFIEHVYVDRGSFVRRGQLLATLSYPEQEATYLQNKANYELAKVTYERDLALFQQNVIARQDLDNAQKAYEAARQAMLAQKKLYDYKHIRAPFEGYIIQRNYDPGHLITPTDPTPLFIIADIRKVRVFVYVPEEDVGLLHVGTPATLSGDAYPGQEFRGEVTKIAQGLDASTRTMQAEIDLVNPGGKLKPGMFARVSLTLERHPNVLVLPAGAILQSEGQSYVYVVADGRAHELAVKTGLREGDEIEITGGIDEGKQVVLTGWEQLRDNVAVRVAMAGPSNSAASAAGASSGAKPATGALRRQSAGPD
jgi:membrane fusion protein, multidrug efflux system